MNATIDNVHAGARRLTIAIGSGVSCCSVLSRGCRPYAFVAACMDSVLDRTECGTCGKISGKYIGNWGATYRAIHAMAA